MGLNLIPLNLESINEVKGGTVSLMIQKALNRMAMDIEAAPDINEFRDVTLRIRAKPVMEQMELASVVVEFEVKGKVPARVTSSHMVVRSNEHGLKQLMFNVDAQDSPSQHTLLPAGRDVAAETGRRGSMNTTEDDEDENSDGDVRRASDHE